MLNAMGVGALDAPRAERVLRISDTGEPDRPHHVADPEGPRTGRARRGPVRPALARIASTRCPASCGCWPSSTPEIRLGGLRDPSTTNAQALECGATAVAHGAGWPGCPTRSGPPCSGGWPARRTCAGSGSCAGRRSARPPAGRTRGRRAPVSERWGRRGGAPGAARPRRAAGARTTVTVRSARPAGGAADRFGDGQGRSDPRSRPVTPGALRRRSRTGRRRRG